MAKIIKPPKRIEVASKRILPRRVNPEILGKRYLLKMKYTAGESATHNIRAKPNSRLASLGVIKSRRYAEKDKQKLMRMDRRRTTHLFLRIKPLMVASTSGRETYHDLEINIGVI